MNDAWSQQTHTNKFFVAKSHQIHKQQAKQPKKRRAFLLLADFDFIPPFVKLHFCGCCQTQRKMCTGSVKPDSREQQAARASDPAIHHRELVIDAQKQEINCEVNLPFHSPARALTRLSPLCPLYHPPPVKVAIPFLCSAWIPPNRYEALATS